MRTEFLIMLDIYLRLTGFWPRASAEFAEEDCTNKTHRPLFVVAKAC